MRAPRRRSFLISKLTSALELGVIAATLVLIAPPPARTVEVQSSTPASYTTPQPQPFKTEELDALVAPVALYPDALLAQVCMASTYPLEVAIAARWQKENQSLQGEQLNAALAMQNWDPSVKALVQVAPVLQMMSDKLDWTQKLGDAFLSQQTEVMASVQRLRQLAVANGQLMTTPNQTVTTMGQVIVIEQANPEVVYVPAYDPWYAYGTWPYAAYPPYYYPGYGFGAGFVLGAILANANWATPHWNWNGGNLEVNPLRNGNIDRGDLGNRDRWQHNVDHRRGVNYRDQSTRERFGRGDVAGANARQNFRGFDQGQLGQGNIGNRASFEQRGGGNGLSGAADGAKARSQSARGASNRASSTRSYGGGGFRGGGGGGFRGGGGRR
jgi:uncharacterized membrane protein YgcG